MITTPSTPTIAPTVATFELSPPPPSSSLVLVTLTVGADSMVIVKPCAERALCRLSALARLVSTAATTSPTSVSETVIVTCDTKVGAKVMSTDRVAGGLKKLTRQGEGNG